MCVHAKQCAFTPFHAVSRPFHARFTPVSRMFFKFSLAANDPFVLLNFMISIMGELVIQEWPNRV